jgi:hypothetical protein
MEYRRGEQEKAWFRSERFYCAGGDWYCTTRGMTDLGPFPDKRDAEGELLLFMRKCGLPAQPFITQSLSELFERKCKTR